MSHGGVTKIGQIGVDGLNELAEWAFAGCMLVSRRPSSPTWWFYGLARDAKVWSWGPKLNSLLSERSKQLLTLVDLEEMEAWCACCDEQLWLGVGMRPASMSPVCWPCIFDRHDLCSRPGGCDNGGEIHMPETIIDPRIARAAA